MLSRFAFLCVSLCHPSSAWGEALASFQQSWASSTYSAGSFGAKEAIAKGSGYWCSSGGHPAGQVITWTGSLGARQKALGLKLQWSYGPGEVKVLTSGDGGNFEEASAWKAAGRGDVAYGETILFASPRSARTVTVMMRSAQPWGYFGISSAALIVEPGPVMLVSDAGAAGGETCLVAKAGRVQAGPCLQAVAAGEGEEVFSWNEYSQLVAVQNRRCAVLEEGDASGRGSLLLSDCADAREAGDGRSIFELTPAGQLRLPERGDYCVRASARGAWAGSCSDEAGGFALASVPEVSTLPVWAAKDAARLVTAAVARQRGLLELLRAAEPKVAGCRLAPAVNASFAGIAASATGTATGSAVRAQSATEDFASAVSAALAVDLAGVADLVAESAEAMRAVVAKSG